MSDDPQCPYGISGDTCMPLMEDYPCICDLRDTVASLRELVKELRTGLDAALALPDQTLARATEPDLRKMTATANEQDALLSRLSDLIAKADKATGDE